MDSKIAILALVVVVAAAAGAYLLSGPGETADNQTAENGTRVNKTIGAAKLVATQSGPESAKPGTNVTITCRIKNTGSGPARKIEVSSQDFDKSFEIIEAGDEVEFQELIYIPTEEEIKMDFGDDATLSNPFFIGGFGVQYTDVTGKHSITANSIEIKLIGVPSSP